MFYMIRLFFFALTLTVTGCATILHGSKQQIGISSTPTGASISINGQNMGVTPTVVKLLRKNTQAIKVEMIGYNPYEIILTRKVDGWIAGNIIFGGLIGLIIDAADGAMYKLSPEQVRAELRGNTVSLHNGANDAILIGVTLTPKADWEKVGYLEKSKP